LLSLFYRCSHYGAYCRKILNASFCSHSSGYFLLYFYIPNRTFRQIVIEGNIEILRKFCYFGTVRYEAIQKVSSFGLFSLARNMRGFRISERDNFIVRIAEFASMIVLIMIPIL